MDQVSFYKMFSINNFQQDQFPIEIQRNFFRNCFLENLNFSVEVNPTFSGNSKVVFANFSCSYHCFPDTDKKF